MITTNKTLTTDSLKSQAQNHRPPKPTTTKPADLLKIGLDVGAHKFVFTAQADNSLPDCSRVMKSAEQFLQWVAQKRATTQRIVVCYEAGFSGFSLARQLHAQGVECLVMAPVRLDEQHSRVANDRLDSRRILGLLDRYLAGNTQALSPVRIPTPAEEIARASTRQLEQLKDHARALQAQGRSLLYFLGLRVPEAWWHSAAWEPMQAELPPPVQQQLARWRRLIEAVEKEITELLGELQPAKVQLPAPMKALPLGLGPLTWLIVNAEVMDWRRFTNRSQPGKFCGLVPSESSTGQSVRQGSITKVGNPRIRRLLIEAVWRLVRYQPEYHALKKWSFVWRDTKNKSKALRKKAVVAVARHLMVDLWRLATGQTTLEKLGLRPATR